MMQYLINAAVGGFAFLCLTALLIRLNYLSWRTHNCLVVGMHVGMAIMCVLLLWRCAIRPDTVGLFDLVAASNISLWVFYSMEEWVDNRPPRRFER